METVLTTAPSQSAGRCVYDVLSASRARLERSCSLGDGLRLAQWYNHAGRHFECRLFPGDHFYLNTSRTALLSYVTSQALASLPVSLSSLQGTL